MARVYPAVIGKRHCGRKIFPVNLLCSDIPSKGSENSPVVTFEFPVSLGMICSRKDLLDSQFVADSLKEFGDKLRTLIG
jgi:hypothetical protein